MPSIEFIETYESPINILEEFGDSIIQTVIFHDRFGSHALVTPNQISLYITSIPLNYKKFTVESIQTYYSLYGEIAYPGGNNILANFYKKVNAAILIKNFIGFSFNNINDKIIGQGAAEEIALLNKYLSHVKNKMVIKGCPYSLTSTFGYGYELLDSEFFMPISSNFNFSYKPLFVNIYLGLMCPLRTDNWTSLYGFIPYESSNYTILNVSNISFFINYTMKIVYKKNEDI